MNSFTRTDGWKWAIAGWFLRIAFWFAPNGPERTRLAKALLAETHAILSEANDDLARAEWRGR